jgi:polyketide cyclase/dehydrase/lipid transport protein
MNVTVSAVIDRPIVEVWRFVAVDHCANHPRWDPSVRSLEPISDGDVRLGYRFRLTRRTMNRVETRDFAVVTWDAPHAMDIETRSADLTLRLRSRAETVDERRTRLVVGGDAQLSGVRGLLAPLFRSRIERDLRANVVRIKAMIEST